MRAVEMYATDAGDANFHAADLSGATLLKCHLEGANLSHVSADRAVLEIMVDEKTNVTGLHGHIDGCVKFVQSTDPRRARDINGKELEKWLNLRGADVVVR
ncbi:pentapeptide repeat-containing protein [Streptomyces physcomitrii]